MAFGATLGLSFGMGIALVGLSLFLDWIEKTFLYNTGALKWILLPTLGYGIALAINSLTQTASCGKMKISQIAIGSSVIPIAIFLFLFLNLSSFVRSPIESTLAPSQRASMGPGLALAFYMFWAGMFGEAIAGGFAQACPAT